MIKVKWTPQILHIESIRNLTDLLRKRGNNFKIRDLTTFELPQINIESTPLVSPSFTNDIEKICLNIVKHIQDVSQGNSQIYQMDLFFKMDDNNKLWLLFSTGIRIKKGAPNQVRELTERAKTPDFRAFKSPDIDDFEEIMEKIKINQGTLKIKNKVESGKYCSKCFKEENSLYALEMKYLLKWKNFDVKDPELQQLLENLWGKEVVGRFDVLKKDKNFLEIKSGFCLKCFMLISEK